MSTTTSIARPTRVSGSWGDGTNWGTVLVAGAWQNLTLGTNWFANVGSYTPSARAEGDTVKLCGVLQTLGSGSSTAATLPASLRPASRAILTVSFEGSVGNIFGQLEARTDGTMALATAQSGSCLLSLDGASFRLS